MSPAAEHSPPVVPAQNTLWFWYRGEAERRRLHGAPADAMRKAAELEARGLAGGGVEIFLMPSRLEQGPGLDRGFCRRFRAAPLRSVHIAETEADFLHAPGAEEGLRRLAGVLRRLDARQVILHAHHLQHRRRRAAGLLARALPGVRVLVENNGFDQDWGSRPESLAAIFADCPEMGLCLDICHVADIPGLELEHFMALPEVGGRLAELHFSLSTRLLPADPYHERGYPGYGPFHALFAAAGREPGPEVRRLLGRCPVVAEGIQPREDQKMRLLRRELELAAEGEEEPCRLRAPSPA